MAHEYSKVNFELTAKGERAVALAVLDHREYVVSGEKAPDFVGLRRGGYGNPFSFSTGTGVSLSHEMAEGMSSALSKKGFKPKISQTSHTEKPEEVLGKLKATGADSLILVRLNEWKPDYIGAYTFSFSLPYKVTMVVYDRAGSIIAEKTIEGKEEVREPLSGLDNTKQAWEHSSRTFKSKMEELFNSPEILRALNGTS